jgi:hypothetical protein
MPSKGGSFSVHTLAGGGLGELRPEFVVSRRLGMVMDQCMVGWRLRDGKRVGEKAGVLEQHVGIS